jgi:hypothetical protein
MLPARSPWKKGAKACMGKNCLQFDPIFAPKGFSYNQILLFPQLFIANYITFVCKNKINSDYVNILKQ